MDLAELLKSKAHKDDAVKEKVKEVATLLVEFKTVELANRINNARFSTFDDDFY